MSNCIAGMGGWVDGAGREEEEENLWLYGPPRPHPGARFGQLSMEAGKSPVRSRIRSQVRALSRVTRRTSNGGNVAHARVAQLEERVLPTVLFAAQRVTVTLLRRKFCVHACWPHQGTYVRSNLRIERLNVNVVVVVMQSAKRVEALDRVMKTREISFKRK